VSLDNAFALIEGHPKFYYSPVNCRSGIFSSLVAVDKKRRERVGHPPQ